MVFCRLPRVFRGSPTGRAWETAPALLALGRGQGDGKAIVQLVVESLWQPQLSLPGCGRDGWAAPARGRGVGAVVAGRAGGCKCSRRGRGGRPRLGRGARPDAAGADFPVAPAAQPRRLSPRQSPRCPARPAAGAELSPRGAQADGNGPGEPRYNYNSSHTVHLSLSFLFFFFKTAAK